MDHSERILLQFVLEISTENCMNDSIFEGIITMRSPLLIFVLLSADGKEVALWKISF
jgi:hypothetical protein